MQRVPRYIKIEQCFPGPPFRHWKLVGQGKQFGVAYVPEEQAAKLVWQAPDRFELLRGLEAAGYEIMITALYRLKDLAKSIRMECDCGCHSDEDFTGVVVQCSKCCWKGVK